MCDYLEKVFYRWIIILKSIAKRKINSNYLGTVGKCRKFPNKLIANVLNFCIFDLEKKNSSNRPCKAEFGGIAK